MQYFEPSTISQNSSITMQDGLRKGLIKSASKELLVAFDHSFNCDPETVVRISQSVKERRSEQKAVSTSERDVDVIIREFLPELLRGDSSFALPMEFYLVVGSASYAIEVADSTVAVNRTDEVMIARNSIFFAPSAFLAYWRFKLARCTKIAETSNDPSPPIKLSDSIVELTSAELEQLAAADAPNSENPCLVNFCPPDQGEGCYAFACQLDICVLEYACGADGCALDACPADGCYADGCALDACAANFCALDACYADFCGGNACGGDACPLDACGGNACVSDLGPVCPANACFANVTPIPGG